ncbi:MAG: ATP-binding protein, partial [Deltaproteobacteria bacterium]|nr:ATP-binding protein [Deltaproteobacteria bacterium]
MAMVDPDRIRQVVINLVDNAMKFTRKGGKITLQLASGEGMAKISVTDTGIGIPRDEQERIFGIFTQAHVPGMWKTGGAGVGLAICKMIMDAHRGTINVTSEPGKGSVFTVELPA